MTGRRKIKLRTPDHGFTIVESLINIIIIAMVGVAILSAVVGGFRFTQLSKERSLALAIANERMEELRNLPYDDLATQFGTIFPPGNILDQETVIRENVTFAVNIRIDYVDDPYDGDALGTVQGKPQDLAPYDYKKVEITVTRLNRPNPAARLVSNVGASAAETASNTGILLVTVLDAAGEPVPQATVTIENPSAVPPVNITTSTDNNGRVMIPSLPPDNQNRYHIEVTKTGYSSDYTSPITVPNPNPVQPDVNIFVQQITTQTLVIDLVSTMTVTVVDGSGSSLPGLNLTTTSEKLTYVSPDVPKYQSTNATDGQGQVSLASMEWGSYLFSLSAPYFICSTMPFPNAPLDPGSGLAVTVRATSSGTAPTIVNVLPNSGPATGPLTLAVTGSSFAFGAAAILTRLGQSDIVGSPVTVNNATELDATFDLTGAATGTWNLIIRNADAQECVQEQALEVE